MTYGFFVKEGGEIVGAILLKRPFLGDSYLFVEALFRDSYLFKRCLKEFLSSGT